MIVEYIKPQFEVGRERVGKYGIVRNDAARTTAVRKVADFIYGRELEVNKFIPSPITEQDWNVAYLICTNTR